MQYLVAAKCLGVKSVLNFYQKPHIRFFFQKIFTNFFYRKIWFFKITGVFWADGTVRIINLTTNRMERFFFMEMLPYFFILGLCQIGEHSSFLNY